VKPEDIPEYYFQLKKAGKWFWKYEDRNGLIQSKSMYQNEITPDGYMVDKNGVWKIK